MQRPACGQSLSRRLRRMPVARFSSTRNSRPKPPHDVRSILPHTGIACGRSLRSTRPRSDKQAAASAARRLRPAKASPEPPLSPPRTLKAAPPRTAPGPAPPKFRSAAAACRNRLRRTTSPRGPQRVPGRCTGGAGDQIADEIRNTAATVRMAYSSGKAARISVLPITSWPLPMAAMPLAHTLAW